MSFKFVGQDTLTYLWGKIKDTFVEKENGKGLSTEDYTTAAKAKVDAIPANPEYTDTTYTASTGLSLSGTAFSLASSGVTAGSYGPSAAVTGNDGNTISVPYITVDDYGRITSIANKTYTSKNTTYESKAAASGGTAVSLVTTGEKYTWNNKGTGTITKVQANGTDVASSGTANIPAASTSAYGVTKLSSSTSSTSTSLAATASAVKEAYDLAASKLDSLSGAVLTTGSQSAGGTKTWGGSQVMANSATSPAIQFRSTAQDTSTGYIYYLGTSSGNTNYSQGKFIFRQYSPASNGNSRTSYYDTFELPNVDDAKSKNNTYGILTTKNAFKTKTYTYKYTSLAAGAYLGITGTNFGVSTPSDFTPIAMVAMTTGSTSVNINAMNAAATGSSTVLGIKNEGSSAVTQTASITILYILDYS